MRDREFDIEMICRFCGSRRIEKWFDDCKIKYLNMCENCMSKDYRGAKVRYAAAVRNPANAVFADHHLNRGEVYVIRQSKQWQHGRNLHLEGFGHATFDACLFT